MLAARSRFSSRSRAARLRVCLVRQQYHSHSSCEMCAGRGSHHHIRSTDGGPSDFECSVAEVMFGPCAGWNAFPMAPSACGTTHRQRTQSSTRAGCPPGIPWPAWPRVCDVGLLTTVPKTADVAQAYAHYKAQCLLQDQEGPNLGQWGATFDFASSFSPQGGTSCRVAPPLPT